MIRSGRHPHEVMFLVSLSIVGVAGLIASNETANRVLKALPPLALVLFYAVLAVGTLLALFGVFTKGLKGPVIESFGLGVFALQLLSYGFAVMAFAGWGGLLSATFPVCMGIANVWRVVQIVGEIRAARVGLVLAPRQAEGP